MNCGSCFPYFVFDAFGVSVRGEEDLTLFFRSSYDCLKRKTHQPLFSGKIIDKVALTSITHFSK